MMIDGFYSQNGRGPKPECSRKKSSPEDLVGLTYLISAAVINPMSWLAMRHRFQRNVSLLFSVLKTSQTHITPALAQLLPRMDYNQFFECT